MLGFSLHGWENAMVISLIIAGFFALIAGVSTLAVVKLQRVELAQAKEEFERYKIDTAKVIAEANARQKEAEVKLEQLRERMGQRHIKGEQFLKILEGKPQAPVEILFVREDGEAFTLALEIRDWLKRALWEVEEPRPISDSDLAPRLAPNHPSAMAAGGQPQGVSVFLRADSQADFEREIEQNPLDPNRPLDTPRKALSNALLDSLGSISGGMSGENGRPGVLRVIIGPKPSLN